MENLAFIIWAASFATGIAIVITTNRKAKREQIKRYQIKARLDRIDKHIELSTQLFQCFLETKDKHYLEYSEEELVKAQQLIDQNEKDALHL